MRKEYITNAGRVIPPYWGREDAVASFLVWLGPNLTRCIIIYEWCGVH
jgi:hypothetical protein